MNTLNLLWDNGPTASDERIRMIINPFGRMAVWINRGSGYVALTPIANKDVRTELISGWVTYYGPQECVGPAPTVTTTVTTVTTTTGGTVVAGRRLLGGSGDGGDAALGGYGEAARSGRLLSAVKKKAAKKKAAAKKKKLANSVAACSLRVEIVKPNFRLQITQPWDTKLCKLRPW